MRVSLAGADAIVKLRCIPNPRFILPLTLLTCSACSTDQCPAPANEMDGSVLTAVLGRREVIIVPSTHFALNTRSLHVPGVPLWSHHRKMALLFIPKGEHEK